MIVLGLTHPGGDDNAAALLVDGRLVAMVEEERLNRIKHARQTPPERAVEWCLARAGISLGDVDVVAIGHSDPRTAFVESSRTVAANELRGRPAFRSLRGELRLYRSHKGKAEELMQMLRRIGGGSLRADVEWVRHHMAHASSAFHLSPFEAANIISLDGSGGQDSGLLGIGRGIDIEVVDWVERETSWGLFYEAFTAALGFRQHSDEGKVMGLAAYGEPGDVFPFIDLDGPGGWPRYDRRAMYREIAGIRKRSRAESPINGYHEHIAARLQHSLEAAIARMSEVLYERTGLRTLALAGGTALNCSSNGKLLALPHVDQLFVQPAASDAGTALGAAVYAHVERTGRRPDTSFDHAYWGPEYSNDEIEAVLRQAKVPYRKVDDVGAETAKLVAEDQIVGWFQGALEIGPRALGARSIVANPTNAAMKDAVNNNVKFREPWRPFAPSILADYMEEYFGTEHPSPFMILAFEAQDSVKEAIPATLHVDGTGRPQTVDPRTNPRYWQMIDEFRKLTGVPVVLNTSFNVDSEPIVCTPKNALATLYMSGMDALAIGDFVVEKRTNGTRS
jgi:carbamoyltransferase